MEKMLDNHKQDLMSHREEIKEIHKRHELQIEQTAEQAAHQAAQRVLNQLLKQGDEIPRGKSKQRRSERPITPAEVTDEQHESDVHCAEHGRGSDHFDPSNKRNTKRRGIQSRPKSANSPNPRQNLAEPSPSRPQSSKPPSYSMRNKQNNIDVDDLPSPAPERRSDSRRKLQRENSEFQIRSDKFRNAVGRKARREDTYD